MLPRLPNPRHPAPLCYPVFCLLYKPSGPQTFNLPPRTPLPSPPHPPLQPVPQSYFPPRRREWAHLSLPWAMGGVPFEGRSVPLPAVSLFPAHCTYRPFWDPNINAVRPCLSARCTSYGMRPRWDGAQRKPGVKKARSPVPRKWAKSRFSERKNDPQSP